MCIFALNTNNIEIIVFEVFCGTFLILFTP